MFAYVNLTYLFQVLLLHSFPIPHLHGYEKANKLACAFSCSCHIR